MPPTVSQATFRARVGETVTFELINQSSQPGKAATVLEFTGETPFENQAGIPMQRVPLTPGNNAVTVRSWEDNVCQSDPGCKYDVVNTGEPGRPVLDPVVIIWR